MQVENHVFQLHLLIDKLLSCLSIFFRDYYYLFLWKFLRNDNLMIVLIHINAIVKSTADRMQTTDNKLWLLLHVTFLFAKNVEFL